MTGGEQSTQRIIRLETALHALRFALDRFTRARFNPAPEYLRGLLDVIAADPGEPCDSEEQHARALKAEATVARVQAELTRIRAITPTWGPVADRIAAALADPQEGTEPRLLDCGLCYEEQGEEVHPHPECRAGKSDAPLVGFARIGLRVEPGFVDGVTAASWSKEPIPSDADSALMPDVEINGARSLNLKDSRRVFAGDEQAQLFVDGRRYTTSSAHPVVVEPFGPGMEGGFVTLTLIADKVTVDGKEINDARS